MRSTYYLVLLFTAAATVCIEHVVSLECYQCKDVRDLSTCNTTMTCRDQETCYMNTRLRSTGETTYLGCQGIGACRSPSRHLVGRRQLNTFCHECCSTNLCNKHLCLHTSPDGNWAVWGDWTSCDVTCANGTRSHMRSCTNPVPTHGGENCTGKSYEHSICTEPDCPLTVHGGWSIWASWGGCSVTCDVGMQRRDRTCNNPHPSGMGDNCFGDAHEDRVCLLAHCSNGGWSSWRQWEACPVTCGGGVRRRHRTCGARTSVQFCNGNGEEIDICGNTPCIQGHCLSTPCQNGGQCYDGSNGYICDCKAGFVGLDCEVNGTLPMDCLDILEHPDQFTNHGDGVYKIITWRSNTILEVFCNMTFDNGGWTVVQRHSSDVDFSAGFKDYVKGFGNAQAQYWLGLAYMEEMTSQGYTDGMLDLTIHGDDGDLYFPLPVAHKLTIRHGPGYVVHFTVEDQSFTSGPFHTYDHDNPWGCARADGGGWWYTDDYGACVNKPTVDPSHTGFGVIFEAMGLGVSMAIGMNLNGIHTAFNYSSQIMFRRNTTV